jgi:hypothetical protein
LSEFQTAIRLVRDPFDNCVARYHLEANNGRMPSLTTMTTTQRYDAISAIFQLELFDWLLWHWLTDWIARLTGMRLLTVSYESMLRYPSEAAAQMLRFAGFSTTHEEVARTSEFKTIHSSPSGRPTYLDHFTVDMVVAMGEALAKANAHWHDTSPSWLPAPFLSSPPAPRRAHTRRHAHTHTHTNRTHPPAPAAGGGPNPPPAPHSG